MEKQMQKLKEELNVNPVGANCIRPHFGEITPKNKKGITLIALIVTIIVMLILVGVTINVALNGGLFEKTEEATRLTQIEAEKEELLSAVVAAIGNDGKVNLGYLDNNLPAGWSGTGGTYKSPKENIYNVDATGNITHNSKEEPGKENKPEGFDWTTIGMNVDTDAEYVCERGFYKFRFTTEGELIVTNSIDDIVATIDATNPENIDEGGSTRSLKRIYISDTERLGVFKNSEKTTFTYSRGFAEDLTTDFWYDTRFTCTRVATDYENV